MTAGQLRCDGRVSRRFGCWWMGFEPLLISFETSALEAKQCGYARFPVVQFSPVNFAARKLPRLDPCEERAAAYGEPRQKFLFVQKVFEFLVGFKARLKFWRDDHVARWCL